MGDAIELSGVVKQESPILLCDEATSALDTGTENDILGSLQQLARGRTSLFIAHRLSTAQQADKVVVLDGVSPFTLFQSFRSASFGR